MITFPSFISVVILLMALSCFGQDQPAVRRRKLTPAQWPNDRAVGEEMIQNISTDSVDHQPPSVEEKPSIELTPNEPKNKGIDEKGTKGIKSTKGSDDDDGAATYSKTSKGDDDEIVGPKGSKSQGNDDEPSKASKGDDDDKISKGDDDDVSKNGSKGLKSSKGSKGEDDEEDASSQGKGSYNASKGDTNDDDDDDDSDGESASRRYQYDEERLRQ